MITLPRQTRCRAACVFARSREHSAILSIASGKLEISKLSVAGAPLIAESGKRHAQILRAIVLSIMAQNVEQLVRGRCPTISEQFLPGLLAMFKQHDVDETMLLAGELSDADLQAIGALRMLCLMRESA